MTNDLKTIGLDFPTWVDAVEAAISSGQLVVTGELGDGQLVQFDDPSGARIVILAADPYSTWAGFASTTTATGHVSMIDHTLAYIEFIDDDGQQIAAVCATLAQGPLLVNEPVLPWQEVAITALGIDVTLHDPSDPSCPTQGRIESPGAKIIAEHDGSKTPDAAAVITARLEGAEYRINSLTGQRFIHATLRTPFALDIVLADADTLPADGTVVTGTVALAASVNPPAGCGGGRAGGCGCGGGGCGC
ncbi:hypothetical protein ACFPVT_06710 [Corynebacterium choanae]|uniref:Uncharacterized protein n=1 Tax=Corynebacterium choanae TaxID=1862358 RepID=A0A3G6J7M1_9CORY|nr:hypothetical protein [Corynebacterium choanae]AZA13773.1 hypothetical protein CCHOA_06905 [Corynebacterium choanae]